MAIARQTTPKTTSKAVPRKAAPVKPVPAKSRAIARKRGVTPFLIGSLFPLVATAFDIGARALPFSLDSVLTVQQTQPLHVLLDLVPLVMWLVAEKSNPPPRSVATAVVQTQEQRPAGGSPVLDQPLQQQRSIMTLQTELATIRGQLEEVRARDRTVRAAFDNIRDAMFTLSVEGIVTNVNRSAEWVLGWTRQEMLDHPIRDLLTLASVPRMEEHLADIVMNPSAAPFCEVEFVHSNGRGLWAEGCTGVLRNEAGEVTELLVTYRDLSHRRPQAELSVPSLERTVPVQDLGVAPQQEERGLPPFSFQVTDSGALTGPGLFAEHPHVTEETGNEHPIEFSFQEASVVASQEPAETSALSFAANIEPAIFVSAPQSAFADESETPLTLAQESNLYAEAAAVSVPSDASADGKIFDFTEALSHVGGDEELLSELATIFLQEYPQALGKLRAAVASGDAEAIMYSAHALRGSMSNFVTVETENAARRLEQIGREGDVAAGVQALRELETVLQRLIPALRKLAVLVPV